MWVLVNFAKAGVQLTMMATPFSTTVQIRRDVYFHVPSLVPIASAL